MKSCKIYSPSVSSRTDIRPKILSFVQICYFSGQGNTKISLRYVVVSESLKPYILIQFTFL